MAIAVEALPAAEEAVAGSEAAETAAGAAAGPKTPRRRAQRSSAPPPVPAPRGGSDTIETGRRAFNALPSGGPEAGRAGVFVRLIWAIAAGLIVLELISQATGRWFNWDLATGWQRVQQPGSYVPLYTGQQLPGSMPPTVTAAMPGVPPNTTGNTAPVAGQVVGFAP